MYKMSSDSEQSSHVTSKGLKPSASNPLNPKANEKKSSLTTEGKDLVTKLDTLKKQMQKNVASTSNFSKEMATLTAARSKKNLQDEPLSTPSIQAASKSPKKSKITQPKIQPKKTTKNISEKENTGDSSSQDELDKITQIRKNIIGFNTRYMSPFNIQLESVYVDHTATNRPYRTVQDMIEYAKRFAANPHTEFSHFGKFSTQMMHYAHDSLLRSFSADKQHFVALPTGSGSTGAIEKTLKILKSLENEQRKPTIYITPYEHHSNILPWVEFYDNINILASDEEGNLLIDQIEGQLIKSPTKNIIVSVSAASNVTSTLTDLFGLNKAIKSAKAKKDIIYTVDCAAYCCHHEVSFAQLDQIDFLLVSPHKNLGGSQACGVLIARKNIVKNAKPTFPGGGTVAFVKGYAKTDVMYDVDIFNRQIAGTPPYLGFYRAALSFQLLKNQISYSFIHKRQHSNTKRFIQIMKAGNAALKQKGEGKKIMIYGDKDFSKRANVITFNILVNGQIMPHNLVSLILADVFGVQLRSGCFCAGPFGMKLLKLDQATVESLQDEVSVGIFRDKPGYLRLDCTFYLQLYEIEYIANAILCVAEYSKTIGLVYTLCNDGEITRHKLFKSIINDKYSLDFANFAKQYVQKDQQTSLDRLENRRETLERQYKRGMNILMKPIEFLRSQINAQTE